MKLSKSKNIFGIAFLFMILIGSMMSVSLGSQSSSVISSLGSVRTLPQIQVTVDFSKVIAVNNLSLGVAMSLEWKTWLTSSLLREKAFASNFKLIRLFDFYINPCVRWDEQNSIGIYDWTNFDRLIESIYEIGAEPMISIGYYDYERGFLRIPSGMGINSTTGLPYAESFGAYAADLVRHFKNSALRVKYWEIWNEPFSYFFERKEDGSYIWGVSNETKLKAFVELFNVAARRMRNVDSEIFLGTDASLFKSFLDYFVQYGEPIDFLSFHKYDAWGTWLYAPEGYLSDDELLKRAGRLRDKVTYTPEEARRIWLQWRGADLPVICSETNLNGAWKNGTDPRIQQVIGAVWYAEALRTYLMNDVRYSIYYRFASDDSVWWNTTRQTRGFGFGMLNSTPPHEEWYPYFLNRLVGNHLTLGDTVYYTLSSSSDVTSVLAWRSNDGYKILVINKIMNTTVVRLRIWGIGNPIMEVAVFKIDGFMRGLQIETLLFSETLNILAKGYSVILFSISRLS